jgi:hypothetical protein
MKHLHLLLVSDQYKKTVCARGPAIWLSPDNSEKKIDVVAFQTTIMMKLMK